MQQKNCILVAFKAYLGATMISVRRYSGISKYFKNTFPKHIPFCVCPLPKFAARINTMFPLYRIGFYIVVKTIRYDGNRIRHVTLYNILRLQLLLVMPPKKVAQSSDGLIMN